MDESSQVQNRRQRRSNVLLTATLELPGRSLDVRLRNLSAEGALVEADGLPQQGTEIIFRRGDLTMAGKLVWAGKGRARIRFAAPLPPEALLRHVPVPRPRPLPAFRRPAVAPQPMTRVERLMEEVWGVPVAPRPIGD
jgi:hypothetical protein